MVTEAADRAACRAPAAAAPAVRRHVSAARTPSAAGGHPAQTPQRAGACGSQYYYNTVY